MSMRSADHHIQAQLRVNAEGLLKNGGAPVTRGWHTGEQALALLHQLASAPASAGDALKLLHELQVYQVELDLQQEQADQNRQQLIEALTGYMALFDQAPFGYLTLSLEGKVTEANRIATAWLGGAKAPIVGCQIEGLLAPENTPMVRAALALLQQGHGKEAICVQPKAGGANVKMVINATPDGQFVSMAFLPTDQAPGH